MLYENGEFERIRPHLTPLECGIIFDGIPEGAILRKGWLIWGIPGSTDWSSPCRDRAGRKAGRTRAWEKSNRTARRSRLAEAQVFATAPAEAQNTVTLVSNLALGAETTVVAGGSNPKYASSFTTGSADGYGLASVTLRLTSAGGSVTLDVAVHRDSSGVPGQRLFALDDPPHTTDCEAEGALCTGDGRMLSNRLEITVPGPGG